MNPCHSWKSAWDSAFFKLKCPIVFTISQICVFTIKHLYIHECLSVSIMDHGQWAHIYSDLLQQNFSILIFNPMIQFISIIFHWIKSQNWFYFLLSLSLCFCFFPFHVRIRNYFGFVSVIYVGLMLVPNTKYERNDVSVILFINYINMRTTHITFIDLPFLRLNHLYYYYMGIGESEKR